MNWRHQNVRLRRLEAEAIYIMREVVSEFRNPGHAVLDRQGFERDAAYRAKGLLSRQAAVSADACRYDLEIPRDDCVSRRNRPRLGLDLIVHVNEEGLARGISPVSLGVGAPYPCDENGGLKQALDKYGFDAAFGGARRDEEKSRAKERIFSPFREPRLGSAQSTARTMEAVQYPYQGRRIDAGVSAVELDRTRRLGVHHAENIPVVPLYFAKQRPVVQRDGALIMVDDDRLPFEPGERPRRCAVRFRTLGCYPLTGAIEFERRHAREIIAEMRGRARPSDKAASSITTKPRRWRRRSARAISDATSCAMAADAPNRALAIDTRPALRFFTCGSVDDGKSTLIGRLLYEQNLIFEDHLAALERDSRKHGTTGDGLDFALLLDGLEAEREQGITIDVAYRYLPTPRRSFIVADTPGHEQYTRNMATGASTRILPSSWSMRARAF